MVCFEVGMSFTGIFSKSIMGIKDLLVVVDDMVGNCIFPARRAQEVRCQTSNN